jgi:hypothetical protein
MLDTQRKGSTTFLTSKYLPLKYMQGSQSSLVCQPWDLQKETGMTDAYSIWQQSGHIMHHTSTRFFRAHGTLYPMRRIRQLNVPILLVHLP